MDDVHDRRRVFLRLTERERFEALFDELMKERAERVKLDARLVVIEDENNYMQGEIEGISHRKKETLDLSTQDKIKAVLSDRWKFWVPIFQHVISTIFTVIVLAILALAFGVVKP